jgi:hypothetical protein
MTTWDLFIFVAGPRSISFMLCPNHRYNLSCLSHPVVYLDTIVVSFHHRFISLAYPIIHARALTQQRQFSVQLLESEEGLGHQRWTSRLLRGIGSDHLRPDPVLHGGPATFDSTAIYIHSWTNDFLVASPCTSSAYVVSSISYTLPQYGRSRKSAPSERRFNTVPLSASGPP